MVLVAAVEGEAMESPPIAFVAVVESLPIAFVAVADWLFSALLPDHHHQHSPSDRYAFAVAWADMHYREVGYCVVVVVV